MLFWFLYLCMVLFITCMPRSHNECSAGAQGLLDPYFRTLVHHGPSSAAAAAGAVIPVLLLLLLLLLLVVVVVVVVVVLLLLVLWLVPLAAV